MASRFYKNPEPINEVTKINTVLLIDFIDSYKIDPKQKFKLISNYLNNWLKNKLLQKNNISLNYNGSNKKL